MCHQDPGAGWDVCGVSGGTKDHTLVRKCGISSGSEWTASAGTNADDCEWIVLDQNDWTYLGSHNSYCGIYRALPVIFVSFCRPYFSGSLIQLCMNVCVALCDIFAYYGVSHVQHVFDLYIDDDSGDDSGGNHIYHIDVLSCWKVRYRLEIFSLVFVGTLLCLFFECVYPISTSQTTNIDPYKQSHRQHPIPSQSLKQVHTKSHTDIPLFQDHDEGL